MVSGNLEVVLRSQAREDNRLSPEVLSAGFCAFLQDLVRNENIGASGAGEGELCPISPWRLIWDFSF